MGGLQCSKMHWKYGKASVAGTSHALLNTPCQDAHRFSIINLADEDILIAIASDGAGSATCSEIGAQTITEIFLSRAEQFITKNNGGQSITKDLFINWIQDARVNILEQAIEKGLSLKDFACTFFAAIVGANENYFVQIGDGAIVVSDRDEPDEYMWIFWPQKGMYFNTTNFVTDEDFIDNLQFEKSEKALRDIALFTDGIEGIALKYDKFEAYNPFFDALFKALRTKNNSENFDAEIAQFLSSEKVNERTDDDKTLIIASRLDSQRTE